MATWQEFADAAPTMADLALSLLAQNEQTAYLATVRADGSPQVHPVMLYVHGGRIWTFIVEVTSKYADLERTGQFALHTAPSGNDAHYECHLSGRAVASHDPALRKAVAESAGIEKADWEILFELSPERALTTTWTGWGTPAIRASFERWSVARGFNLFNP